MLKFAIFGAGFIGRVHAANIHKHPQATLATIYDVNTQAASELADATGAQVAPDADVIWSDDTIDAVVIASSTDTHVDLLHAAIAAGKPTFCEKPIDLDMARVRDVATRLHASDVPVWMGFSRRFDADHAEVYDRFQAGEIGQLEMMHLTTRGPTPPPISYVKVSGGQFRDQTIHFFDMAAWLSSEQPTEVYAAGANLVDPAIGAAGDIDTSMVTLRLPSGTLVHIDSSRRAAYGYDERVELFGSGGMLESGRKHLSDVRRYTPTGVQLADMHPGWFERIEASFATLIDRVIRRLHGDVIDLPTFWDGLRAQQIAEAAVQSLQTNQPVSIDYWTPGD